MEGYDCSFSVEVVCSSRGRDGIFCSSAFSTGHGGLWQSINIYPGDTLDANALFPLGDTGDRKSFQNTHTFPALTNSENSYDKNQEILARPLRWMLASI